MGVQHYRPYEALLLGSLPSLVVFVVQDSSTLHFYPLFKKNIRVFRAEFSIEFVEALWATNYFNI